MEFDGSEHITTNCQPTEENPFPPGINDEPFLAHSRFDFIGTMLGESPLSFELEVDGEVVDECKYTIRVVDDACEGEIGIAANRCGLGDRYPDLSIAIFEHESRQTLVAGETLEVTLPASAIHPEAPWRVAEIDATVLSLRASQADATRTPGDWNTSDRDKPWHFLPVWRLTFEGTSLGESPLVLEVVVDGDRVDVFEITVNVVEDAPEDA